MADTLTANYNWIKPEVGASSNSWGTKWNDNLDGIDARIKSNETVSAAALPLAGGTMTGALVLAADPVVGKGAATKDYVDAKMLAALLPVGIILMWGGAVATIPAGWALCNGQIVGTVQTPNLADRFVVAASAAGTYQPGFFGGSASHDHGGIGMHTLTIAEMPAHAHSVYDPSHYHGYSDPGHVHSVPQGGGAANLPIGSPSGGTIVTQAAQTTGAAACGITISYGYTSLSLYNQGGGVAHNHPLAAASHIPPYYAVCYIMKVA